MSPLVELFLRMGDNALILGHRVSEWCGHAPALEEDTALANTALNLIGQTLMRQFLFDAWHHGLLAALADSSDPRVAAIAAKAEREAAYHLERSSDLVIRLGDGTEEANARMQAALDDQWTYAGEMFAADPVDAALAAEGIAPDPASLKPARGGAGRRGAARSNPHPAGELLRPPGRQDRPAYRAPRPSPYRDAFHAARLPRRELVRCAPTPQRSGAG